MLPDELVMSFDDELVLSFDLVSFLAIFWMILSFIVSATTAYSEHNMYTWAHTTNINAQLRMQSH